MNISPAEKSAKKIRILLFATFPIVVESLKLLLENSKNMTVLECCFDTDKLIEWVQHNKTDVILIDLADDNITTVDIIQNILKVNAESRVIVLASNKDTVNQTKALQAGASGIVQKEQNPRMLIEAIRQVYEGETWINQKLLSQLINNGSSHKTAVHKTRETLNFESLTDREREVVFMIARGLKNKDIASKLFISEATVRHHLSSIYNKLEIPDRLNLVIYAYQHGLIDSFINKAKAKI